MEKNTPSVSGSSSFNDGAGMSHQQTLAAFIFWNMPYLASPPVLSQEEAMDVAAYILQQPRPHTNLN